MGLFDIFKKKSENIVTQAAVPEKTAPVVQLASKEEDIKLPFLCGDICEYELRYKYDDVDVVGTKYIEDLGPFNHLIIGQEVEVVCEKDNQYDDTAILINTKNGEKLGYLPKSSKIKDMAFDFIKKSKPIQAKVISINKNDLTFSVLMGFYDRPEPSRYEVLNSSDCKRKIFKLTANANEDMQLALGCVSEGDPVDFDYDFDKEKYIVSAEIDEVGYLGKKDSKCFESNINESDYEAFIKEVSETENDKIKASVIVFWKESEDL